MTVTRSQLPVSLLSGTSLHSPTWTAGSGLVCVTEERDVLYQPDLARDLTLQITTDGRAYNSLYQGEINNNST